MRSGLLLFYFGRCSIVQSISVFSMAFILTADLFSNKVSHLLFQYLKRVWAAHYSLHNVLEVAELFDAFERTFAMTTTITLVPTKLDIDSISSFSLATVDACTDV